MRCLIRCILDLFDGKPIEKFAFRDRAVISNVFRGVALVPAHFKAARSFLNGILYILSANRLSKF
jgi:hypothetical protein